MIAGQPVARGTGEVVGTYEHDSETVELHVASKADAIAVSWAWTSVVAAKLWRDQGMRDAFVAHMILQPTPGYVRVDDAHRLAASFGQLVHAPDCQLGLSDDRVDGECSDDCAIVPCEEDDATVVLIRVEVNARKVDDDA